MFSMGGFHHLCTQSTTKGQEYLAGYASRKISIISIIIWESCFEVATWQHNNIITTKIVQKTTIQYWTILLHTTD